MKTKLALLVFLFTIGTVAAQQNRRPSVEEMQTAKWNFLVEKSALTAKEQTAVRPIFDEYEKAGWQLHKNFRDKCHKSQMDELSEDELRELNRSRVDMEVNRANLLKQYNTKLEAVLSPKKLFLYYKAEREYKRDLFTPDKPAK